jgi:hypothetical protein
MPLPSVQREVTNMKKYTKPSVEITAFESENILTTSGLSTENSNSSFQYSKMKKLVQLK